MRGRFIPNDHSASHFAPFDHESRRSFVAQPSRDAALTSFAQLGTIRLGARRALISLFDRTNQHVLTEATPTLSLVGGHAGDERDALRVGTCIFPRERGLCTFVSTLPSPNYPDDPAVVDGSAVVVSDVTKEDRFQCARLLSLLADVRFYAAVPIISPRGFTIGAFSVWDTEPRPEGVDTYSLQFMKDMAATVMEHLQNQHSRHKSQLAERMIVGLGSFVEGRATLRDSWREANAQYAASEQSGETTEGQLNIHQQDLQEAGQGTKQEAETAEVRDAGQSIRSVFAGEESPQDVLSTGIQRVFSRASNLIRESIGAEGVVFLDANSERFGNLVGNSSSRKVTGFGNADSPESSDESTDSGMSTRRRRSSGSDKESAPVCVSLGFSTSRASSINNEAMSSNQVVVRENVLTSLLRRYPRGKIFTYNANRSVSDDSDDTSHTLPGCDLPEPNGQGEEERRRSGSKKRRKPNFRQDAGNLIQIFPDARNIILLPMWDSDKRRCFAGALVWTNNPERVFTVENELAYLSAFGNSIMAEIRRLDVEMSEKAKTNLVSSITHELRNPLHGILGTADILSDTAMNALQHGMVHTIESCGRTLLDTINNLLDLTFIDKYQKRHSPRYQAKQRQLPSGESQEEPGVKSSRSGKAPSYTHVKLDQVLEEVTECVFAGYSFYHHPQAPPPALADSSSRATGESNQVTIIFDIQPNVEWGFYTHAGAWRRILMNIFGNALKYTASGYIYLQLKCEPSRKKRKHSDSSADEEVEDYEVTLTVQDTGKGIGAEYLQRDLFTPFTQENPLASGSGLGLSIVRQAVGALGGSIEINSTKGVGTELTIRTPLTHYPSASSESSSDAIYTGLRESTEGKSIGLLGFGSALKSNRDTALYSSLARVCEQWFGLEVISASPLKGQKPAFDFYLAVQTELDSEDLEGRNLFNLAPQLVSQGDEAPIVVVICQSPEEAHSMFVAAKNRGISQIFEFVSQPCGPRKLARALELCIKRRRDEKSGRRTSEEPTRWVEMPESSHLPVDVGPSDPPDERMKVSKRPTTDTMRSQSMYGSWKADLPHGSGQPSPSTLEALEKASPTPSKSVLLVDDNDLNLQLLCAYTKKDGRDFMTGKNGVEAVEIYKAHPGRFRVVVMGIAHLQFFCHTVPLTRYRYFHAPYGRL